MFKTNNKLIISRRLYEIISLSIIDVQIIDHVKLNNNDIKLPYSTFQNPDDINNFSFEVNLDKLEDNYKYLLSVEISGNAELIIDGILDQSIDAGHTYSIFNGPKREFILRTGSRELFGRNQWDLSIKSIKIITINYTLFQIGMELLQLYNYANTMGRSKNKIYNSMLKYLSTVYESPNIEQITGLAAVLLNKKHKELIDFLSDIYGYPVLNKTITDYNRNKINMDRYNNILDEIAKTINEISDSKYKNNTMFTFGHCHIDVAWLWPYSETVRKIQRSFSNVLKLYDMDFNFAFAQSTALYYYEIEKNNKSIFNKIKKLVKEDKWIPVGGMWVESDTNLIRGESLARQLLYGQSYFMEAFNRYARIAWLPDTFGFSGQLPQLFVKSGMNAFVTHKPMWNDTTEFPYHCFKWSGIDNTSIMTSISSLGYNENLDFDSIINACKLNKNSDLPITYLYGYGDGGGGPDIEMMLKLNQAKHSEFMPRVKSSFNEQDYISNLDKFNDKMPTYNGEIYLENHRGVYTTNHEIKKFVATLEDKLSMLEFLNSMNYGSATQRNNTKNLWYNLLKAQFHDILPGSAYYYAYEEEFTELDNLNEEIDKITIIAIKIFIENKNIKKGLIAINNSQYSFTGYLEIDSSNLPSEMPGNGVIHTMDKDFVLINVPALGFATVDQSAEDNKFQNPVKIRNVKGKYIVQNAKLKLIINSKGIISFFHNNKKYIKNGNIIRIYNDVPSNFDAWNIDVQNIKNDMHMEEIKTDIRIISENTIGVIEIKRTFEDSSFIIQKIIVKPDSDIVEFENTAILNNREKLVKVLFEPGFTTDYIRREIPFGYVRMKLDSANEKTHFEFPALRYVDYSDNDHGFSIVSRESHGYSFISNKLGISIGKTPLYPNPFSDRNGIKEKFYVCLHDRNYNIYKEANFIFNPVKLYNNKYDGNKKKERLLNFSGDDIILENIKISENEQGLIARFYNCSDKISNFELKIPDKDIYETDILENNKIKIDKNIIFKPFEIKTLLIEKIH
ncbi:alpha-mannosidase [Ferroplasma acidiphilum]|uniref:Alpha-mannosidase n=1 Tax=Ferroplasma acidiphilum TaxID=74969 RepID=A0A1V0N473_9ARCH|nr:glycoside hydrolase family 38 C-terminal domain-containing protein [Ferroplasma acidiphilum]ARD84911.1 alpha-mannosidase [Ferroplasma acidiphilum]